MTTKFVFFRTGGFMTLIAATALWGCEGTASISGDGGEDGPAETTPDSADSVPDDAAADPVADDAAAEEGPDPCGDGLQNGGETDVDCGGPDCDPCGEGQSCTIDSDCAGGTCCSGACCAAGLSCFEEACCTPRTCEEMMFVCGLRDDGCGGTIDCGGECECTFAVNFVNEPWCYCGEGWRPVASKHNGRPQQTGNEGQECGATCGNYTFTIPEGTVHKIIRGRSNARPGGSVMFFARDGCRQTSPEPYVATPPSDIYVSEETQHASNAAGCCILPEDGIDGGLGSVEINFDFTGLEGTEANAGVYNDEATDCVTGIDACLQCDPLDEGYPDYGTGIYQCE